MGKASFMPLFQKAFGLPLGGKACCGYECVPSGGRMTKSCLRDSWPVV